MDRGSTQSTKPNYPIDVAMLTPLAELLNCRIYPLAPGDHSSARLKALVAESVAALKGNKIRVFYLHAPDQATPWAETLKAINELYHEGTLWVPLSFVC